MRQVCVIYNIGVPSTNYHTSDCKIGLYLPFIIQLGKYYNLIFDLFPSRLIFFLYLLRGMIAIVEIFLSQCGNVAWKRIIITLKGRMFYVWLSLANKKRGFLLVTYNKGLFRPSAYQADSLSEISEILV